MKLTVIGFWGAYPEESSATSAYLLEKDGFACLLDCGSGALSRLQSYINLKDINAVVLSHYHNDHIADIGVLQYRWLVHHYIDGTDHVLPIYGHMDDKVEFDKLTHQFTKGIAYDPSETVNIGPFSFTFMKTNHPVPCYAMRIEDGKSSIVYSADSSYKNEFVSFSENADILISECSFYEHQDGTNAGHMNSRECAEIANNAGVKELILTHLPHFGDRNQLVDEAKQYFNGMITLASEGLVREV